MIVVDMESSGLDPVKHGLLSIGAVDFSNYKNTFYGECRLFEGGHIDKAALAVNGFSEGEIKDPKKQSDGELMSAFLEWAEACPEKTLAGQNPSADRDFLRAAACRNRIDWQFAYRVIDLHSIAYFHMLRRGISIPIMNEHSALSLDKILLCCGLPEEPKPHNGLRGAILEAEAFYRLFYDENLFPEYKQFSIPWAN